MHEVYEGLFVGDATDCQRRRHDDAWAIVHACRDPCHRRAVGYSGTLHPSHERYLIDEREADIYLNLVDLDDRPYRRRQIAPTIAASLHFLDTHLSERPVLLHDVDGRSIAPTLAMCYLARSTDAITDGSFDRAKRAFAAIYPRYRPGYGIEAYLSRVWDDGGPGRGDPRVGTTELER